MESDDENLIIPPEHLNLSDEPELQLSDDPIPGPSQAQGSEAAPAQASGDAPASRGAKAAAVMDTEWDTFQMSIARSGSRLIQRQHFQMSFIFSARWESRMCWTCQTVLTPPSSTRRISTARASP